jgi:hypothetical protein
LALSARRSGVAVDRLLIDGEFVDLAVAVNDVVIACLTRRRRGKSVNVRYGLPPALLPDSKLHWA